MSEAVPCTDLALWVRSDLVEIRRGYVSDLFYCPGDIVLNMWMRFAVGPDGGLTGTCPSYGSSSSLVLSIIVWSGILALLVQPMVMSRTRRKPRFAAVQRVSHLWRREVEPMPGNLPSSDAKSGSLPAP